MVGVVEVEDWLVAAARRGWLGLGGVDLRACAGSVLGRRGGSGGVPGRARGPAEPRQRERPDATDRHQQSDEREHATGAPARGGSAVDGAGRRPGARAVRGGLSVGGGGRVPDRCAPGGRCRPPGGAAIPAAVAVPAVAVADQAAGADDVTRGAGAAARRRDPLRGHGDAARQRRLQRVHEVAGGLEALVGLLGHAAHQHLVHGSRQGPVTFAGAGAARPRCAGGPERRSAAREGPLAGEQLEGGDGQRVAVEAPVASRPSACSGDR